MKHSTLQIVVDVCLFITTCIFIYISYTSNTIPNKRPKQKQPNLNKPNHIHQKELKTPKNKSKLVQHKFQKPNKHFYVDINQIDALIHGFIRQYQYELSMNILTDLIIFNIKQFIDYFKQIKHISFDYCLTGDCTINLAGNTKMTVKYQPWNVSRYSSNVTNSGYLTCNILGTENKTYIAQFKILGHVGEIYIGIMTADFNETFHERWSNSNIFNNAYNSNVGYAYCNDGKKIWKDASYKQAFSHPYGAYSGRFDDTVYLKLEFDEDKEYGSLYFKLKNNKYFIKKGGNKWKDTKYEIPKEKKIKIAVSLTAYKRKPASLKLIGVWCNRNQHTPSKTELLEKEELFYQ